MLPATLHLERSPTVSVRLAVIVAAARLDRRVNGRRSDAFGRRLMASVSLSPLSLLLLLLPPLPHGRGHTSRLNRRVNGRRGELLLLLLLLLAVAIIVQVSRLNRRVNGRRGEVLL